MQLIYCVPYILNMSIIYIRMMTKNEQILQQTLELKGDSANQGAPILTILNANNCLYVCKEGEPINIKYVCKEYNEDLYSFIKQLKANKQVNLLEMNCPLCKEKVEFKKHYANGTDANAKLIEEMLK